MADSSGASGYDLGVVCRQAMSEEQLTDLLAKIKEDVGLQEKLKGAADLDAAVAMAKEAGFDVSKAAWLRYQANQTLELSDEELESITGGLPGQEPWSLDCPGRRGRIGEVLG